MTCTERNAGFLWYQTKVSDNLTTTKWKYSEQQNQFQ